MRLQAHFPEKTEIFTTRELLRYETSKIKKNPDFSGLSTISASFLVFYAAD